MKPRSQRPSSGAPLRPIDPDMLVKSVQGGKIELLKMHIKMKPYDWQTFRTVGKQQSLLTLALENRHVHIVEFLVKQGMRFDNPEGDGNTPLHVACGINFCEAVELFCKSCSDPAQLTV